jgi:hypothetical protein
MSLYVLALVLAAAVLHASWNLLAKKTKGKTPFIWLQYIASNILYLPFLFFQTNQGYTIYLQPLLWFSLSSAVLHLGSTVGETLVDLVRARTASAAAEGAGGRVRRVVDDQRLQLAARHPAGLEAGEAGAEAEPGEHHRADRVRPLDRRDPGQVAGERGRQ